MPDPIDIAMKRAALFEATTRIGINLKQIERMNDAQLERVVDELEIKARTAYYEALTDRVKDVGRDRAAAAERSYRARMDAGFADQVAEGHFTHIEESMSCDWRE